VDADALVADLDADQRRAVTTDSRLVAVIAGAGSGKTRVLTRRLAYRVVTGSADIDHTLVLTFTREAAGELRRRLPRLGITGRIVAGTFHSVAHQLLQQRWTDLGQQPKTLATDRKRLVSQTGEYVKIDELVADLDWATSRGISASEYSAAIRREGRHSNVDSGTVAEVLEKYIAEKRKRGVIDLDDLLGMIISALRSDEGFADGVRWRFRHVLIDEAQDLNPLQHRLVDLFRHKRDDLFLVGDPAQAIYGFNGSDPALLVNVEDRFPGVEIVRLPLNHRSTPQVVGAGAHALTTNGQRADVRSNRPDGSAVTIAPHEDEHGEATAVARNIARLDPTLVRGGNVAVLARTHAVLGPIRAALARAGLTVRTIVDGPGSVLAPHLQQAYRSSSGSQLRRWVHDSLDDADDDDPLREVALVGLNYLREQPNGDGPGMRAWVNSTDPFGRNDPGVDVLTFHGSKGREWHTVFLVGCETSLVPHRSATTNVAKAEEARLLYVALTRATDDLHVNWAMRRHGYQRKLTPLLDDFESDVPESVPPPFELARMRKTDRQVTIERLRDWRSSVARAGGILPDAVCTDSALAAIADARPIDATELDAVTGFGPITSGRLFQGVAEALAAARTA
jgi:DNA helicase-2/ATP-dependent DNA helicase PcrA